MTRFVSLTQFVNLWECDENDHMNVQFYFAKFEDAATVFLAKYGLEARVGKRLWRNVRYLSELRGGEAIKVLSSVVIPEGGYGDEGGCQIQHLMIETKSGRLAATALDAYLARPADWPQEEIGDALTPEAAPRSMIHTADTDPLGWEDLRDRAWAAISAGVLHPRMTKADGQALDQAYIGAVSDAAPHAWGLVGLDGDYLESKGFGRVAVEMRLVEHDPVMAGDCYELQLGYTGLGSRSMTKRYDFVNLRDGNHHAVLEATVMILNHETRRSEPLPDFAREAVERSIAKDVERA